MNYTYSLEKSSKKHICPQCNKKRYVRFVNNETNEYAEYKFGRCDRESSCGYFVTPSISKLSNDYITATRILPKLINFIDKNIPKTTLKLYNKNNFFLYLITYFDEKLVLQTFKRYNVGTSKKWNGSTVFWQQDKTNQYRTGKIMLYNKSNGKRVKKPYNHISWAHKALNISDFNLKQCLFGLHLTTDKTKTIGLVEAEKTAITMNLFLPNCYWLATGSKQNLKEELLKPIKGFKIIAYPDKSEFKDWLQKCEKLTDKGFDITCSELVEKSSSKEGSDLADIYFDLENKKTENIKLSKTEQTIKKLNSKNSSLKTLIATFDLTDEAGNDIKTNLLKDI